jgi:hypothetical protein
MRITFFMALFLCGLFAIGTEPARARVVEEDQYTFFAQIGDTNTTLSAQFVVPSLVTLCHHPS